MWCQHQISPALQMCQQESINLCLLHRFLFPCHCVPHWHGSLYAAATDPSWQTWSRSVKATVQQVALTGLEQVAQTGLQPTVDEVRISLLQLVAAIWNKLVGKEKQIVTDGWGISCGDKIPWFVSSSLFPFFSGPTFHRTAEQAVSSKPSSKGG